jgi:hypothetical protein
MSMLCARVMRGQQFHRRGIHPGLGVALRRLRIRLQRADEQGAARHLGQIRGLGRAHREHDAGAGQRGARVGHHLGARVAVGLVGQPGGGARAGLHRHGAPEADQLLHRLGRRGDPGLAPSTLAQHSHAHADIPTSRTLRV